MAYRILSLDGGGSWAMLQAMALAEIYGGDTAGPDILKTFDLAVANSGGSIVLAGLMLGKTPSQMVDLFLTNASQIFVKAGIIDLVLHALGLPVPKFSTAGKLKGLQSVFGPNGATMMAAWALPPGPNGKPVRAMIVGFDYDRHRAQFFRSFASGGGAPASQIALVDAVHASSDAPVIFFDKPTSCGTPPRRYWDGAIGGYNNPLMTGVVELMTEGVAAKDIQVRSIGTATVRLAPTDAPNTPQELRDDPNTPGIVSDLKELAGSITDDPPDAANYVAFNVLGNKMPAPPPQPGAPIPSGSIVRLSPSIQPLWTGGASPWAAPTGYSLADFKHISRLDMAATDATDLAAIRRLGAAWIAGDIPNQPVMADSDTYRCIIGDPTFPAGKGRW